MSDEFAAAPPPSVLSPLSSQEFSRFLPSLDKEDPVFGDGSAFCLDDTKAGAFPSWSSPLLLGQDTLGTDTPDLTLPKLDRLDFTASKDSQEGNATPLTTSMNAQPNQPGQANANVSGDVSGDLRPPALRRYVSIPKIQLNFADAADAGLSRQKSTELDNPSFGGYGNNVSMDVGLGMDPMILADMDMRDGLNGRSSFTPRYMSNSDNTESESESESESEDSSSDDAPILERRAQQRLRQRQERLQQQRESKQPKREQKGFACVSCRISKTKCEGGFPCGRCTRLGRECKKDDRHQQALRAKLKASNSIKVDPGPRCYRNRWCVRNYRHPGHCKHAGHTRKKRA